MKQTLDVYLHNKLSGHLYQNEHGQTLFQYSEIYLKDPSAIALSISLPLQQEVFGEKDCKPYFSGILPEDAKRKIIARYLGISTQNDFAMLEQIGGECAGAITFLQPGSGLPDQNANYKSLSIPALEQILRELPRKPLMAGEEGVRLSLAGAQDKIAVYKVHTDFFLPLDNAPSSHIIKPDVEQYEGLIFNEAFCMKLAARMGLNVAPVETGNTGNIAYLIIERYDRIKTENTDRLSRVHQEDFCQALGIIPERKYQIEGGPTLTDCFTLIREFSTKPSSDIMQLLDAVIFNFLIGNHDAHGKNFSLLYGMAQEITSKQIRLAPLYDLISTMVYPELSKRLAMNIGSVHTLEEIGPRQFEKFAEQTALSKPLVKQRVVDHARKMITNLDSIEVEHPIVNKVKERIDSHCKTVIAKFS